MHEFQLTNQAAIDEFAAQNLKVIDVPSSPAYSMLCTRPIESPSDAAGVRARTSGPVWSATLAALGMVTVDVSFTEAYEALQRGVIDCMVNLPSAFTLLGLDEVAKEFVPLPFAQSYTVFAMNLDTWESLPGEVQEIMHEEAGTAAVAMWDKILDEEAGFGELLQSGEIRVNDASALVPTVDAQRGEALTDMVASAPEAVDDPQAVVDDYLERQEYWTQVLVDLGYEIRATDPDAVRGSFAELADVDLSDFQDRFAEEVIEATRPE